MLHTLVADLSHVSSHYSTQCNTSSPELVETPSTYPQYHLTQQYDNIGLSQCGIDFNSHSGVFIKYSNQPSLPATIPSSESILTMPHNVAMASKSIEQLVYNETRVKFHETEPKNQESQTLTPHMDVSHKFIKCLP